MHKENNTDDNPGRQGSQTLAEKVADHIRDEILAGHFVPGQRLIEADITSELGVSRGPLREAFRKLSAEGLLESIPNKGAIVRRFSHQEIHDLFEIRIALEALAARLATRNMAKPGVKAAFEQAIECIWRPGERSSGMSYLSENKAFHQAIADASGNVRLSDLCRQMRLPLIMLQTSRALDSEVLQKSNVEHRLIAERILAGDEDGAAQASEAHLKRAQSFTSNLPGRLFSNR